MVAIPRFDLRVPTLNWWLTGSLQLGDTGQGMACGTSNDLTTQHTTTYNNHNHEKEFRNYKYSCNMIDNDYLQKHHSPRLPQRVTPYSYQEGFGPIALCLGLHWNNFHILLVSGAVCWQWRTRNLATKCTLEGQMRQVQPGMVMSPIGTMAPSPWVSLITIIDGSSSFHVCFDMGAVDKLLFFLFLLVFFFRSYCFGRRPGRLCRHRHLQIA